MEICQSLAEPSKQEKDVKKNVDAETKKRVTRDEAAEERTTSERQEDAFNTSSGAGTRASAVEEKIRLADEAQGTKKSQQGRSTAVEDKIRREDAATSAPTAVALASMESDDSEASVTDIGTSVPGVMAVSVERPRSEKEKVMAEEGKQEVADDIESGRNGGLDGKPGAVAVRGIDHVSSSMEFSFTDRNDRIESDVEDISPVGANAMSNGADGLDPSSSSAAGVHNSIDDSGAPVLVATLVYENETEVKPVLPEAEIVDTAKRKRRIIIVLVCLAALGAMLGVVFGRNTSESIPTPAPTFSMSPTVSLSPTESPSSAPTRAPLQFQSRFELGIAVNRYLADSRPGTEVAQDYGWPIALLSAYRR